MLMTAGGMRDQREKLEAELMRMNEQQEALHRELEEHKQSRPSRQSLAQRCHRGGEPLTLTSRAEHAIEEAAGLTLTSRQSMPSRRKPLTPRIGERRRACHRGGEA